MTVALTQRETLSHDHLGALLWPRSERGKRGLKRTEEVTWGAEGEGCGRKVKREGELPA